MAYRCWAQTVLAAALVLTACSGDDTGPGVTPGGGAGGSGAGSGAGGSGSGACSPVGPLSNGASYTLCGSGFGTKPAAAPILYDDFEGGARDELLVGWNHYGNSDVVPVYGDQHSWGGAQSAFIDLPAGTYANGAYLSGLALTEVYFSYRVFVVDGGGTPTDPPQVKMGRVTSAAIDVLHGSPNIVMGVVGTFAEGTGNWSQGGSEVPETFYGERPQVGEWARVEHYLRLSNPPGAANGKRWAKFNLRGGMTYSQFPGGHFADPYGTGVDPDAYDGAELVTLTTDADDVVLNNVLIPFFTRPEQLISLWVDEVFVDSTQARVELGDAPAWGDCADRSPQPATAWSDGAVTIELNQGRLSGEAYAFVVTTEGQIHELGAIGTWP